MHVASVSRSQLIIGAAMIRRHSVLRRVLWRVLRCGACCGAAARGVHISSFGPEPKWPTAKAHVSVSALRHTKRLLSLSATMSRPRLSARPSGWLNSSASCKGVRSVGVGCVGGGKGSGEWGGSGMWRAVRGGLGSAICQRTTAAALRPQAGDGLAALEAHLPNAVVRAVTHKQVLAVRRQTARVSEYALAVMALDRQPQLALRVEDLDAIVVAICNHNAPIRQRHNMRRTPEADQDCHRRDGGAHVVGFGFG